MSKPNRVDGLHNVVNAYVKPNNSKAQTKRVIDGLRAMGFEGDELLAGLAVLGWNDPTSIAIARVKKGEP